MAEECPSCEGTGSIGASEDYRPCFSCKGTGHKSFTKPTPTVAVPRSLLTAALVDAGQVQAYLGLLPIQGVPGSESMCDVADRLVKRLTVALGGEEGADGKE